MTDPVLSIEPDRISVEPGGQASVVLTIANQGTIVEGFRVDVVDDQSGSGALGPASWSEFIPPEGASREPGGALVVSVYPQQQQQVTVVFSPPSGAQAPGGESVFGLRVVSVVDPAVSVVVEGDVEVGQVFGVQAKLVPVTSSGRWRGRHTVQLSNWGNAPTRLRLLATDPDQALGFMVRPEVIDLPLGGSATARVTARTRHPRLRGAAARLPFTITGQPDPAPVVTAAAVPGLATPDPARPSVDGAFTQKAILSRGTVGAAGLAAVLAIGLAAWAFTRAEAGETFQEQGVPPTPLVAAVAAGPSAVRLSWPPLERVQGYRLLHLGPDGRAVESTEQLAKEVGAHQVDDLDADRRYCFQLVAIRGDLESPPSERACARTGPAPTAGSGSTTRATPTPASTTAGAGQGGGPGGGPGPGASRPAGGATSAGATTGAPTQTQPGGAPSSASPPVEPTSVGVVPPGAPELAGGKQVMILRAFAELVPLAKENAEELVGDLQDDGVEARLLHTTDYPDIDPTFTPSWLVYLGPYDDTSEARSDCAAVKTEHPNAECVLATPSP